MTAETVRDDIRKEASRSRIAAVAAADRGDRDEAIRLIARAQECDEKVQEWQQLIDSLPRNRRRP
jgi:hypothetical protein